MKILKALMGQTAVWASALCDGDDSVARADSETICVLGRRVTLQSPGPNQMQSLSTEKACKSSMRLAEARARRTVVLRDSSFKPTDAKGSNGGCERALNTTSCSQGGNKSGRGGCSLFAPLRKLTTKAFLPNDCPLCGERTRQCRSVSMATIHYPVCTAGNSEHTIMVQVAGLI